jgi:nitroreductase/NAD-dependent dihydropyrimidine dehydrogenase PreA subunit
MQTVSINNDLCTACGACVDVCPDKIFTFSNGTVTIAPHVDCLRCWHCLSVCPPGAVSQAGISMEDCPPILVADLPTQSQLITAFRARRSTRSFLDRPVPREIAEALIDGARWTPSASNGQSMAWIALDDPDQIRSLGDGIAGAFARAADLLRSPIIRVLGPLVLGADRFAQAMHYRAGLESIVAEHARGEDPIFHHAPLVLIGHTPSGDDLGRDDAIYQAYNIMLLAQRMKLGTCQIGYLTAVLELNIFGLNRALVKRLNLPVGRKAQVALTAGYPRYHFRRAVPRRVPEIIWNSLAVRE